MAISTLISLVASVLAAEQRPWAVVTGASSGIGAEIARQAAERHYDTILVARRGAKLEALADELRESHGGQSLVVEADLSVEAGQQALYRAAATRNVQLLVLNAGVCRSGDLVTQSSEDVSAMLRLNIDSNVALLQEFGPQLARQGSGRILIIASSAGAAPGVPGVAVYAATKAFLRSLAAGAASELRHSGVGVTLALPSAVDSEFASQSGLDQAAVFNLPFARHLGGIVMQPRDVARSVLSATHKGRREVVPGLMPKLYVGLSDHRVLPPRLSRALASFCFGNSPWRK
jgi:short-subunit dehydrogenase